MAVRSRAPGKLILIGEHAAVYGRPAVVGAIDLAVTAELRPFRDPAAGREDRKAEPSVRLRLPSTEITEEIDLPWREILEFTEEARRHWQAIEGTGARFAPLEPQRARIGDAGRLVALALGEARRELGAGRAAESLLLEITSELPIGSGLGSSAALSAAVVSALLARELSPSGPEPSRVESLALDVERHQHGSPSGIDTAAVVRGGLLWVGRDEEGAPVFETLTDSSSILGGLEAWLAGPPREGTGEVVSAVRALSRAEPALFAGAIDAIEQAALRFRSALADGDGNALRASLREASSALVELGVVPEPVARLLRELEDSGAAAKISGAGALTGESAGALLVYHPGESAKSRLRQKGYRRLEASLGAPGLDWRSIE